MSSSHSTSQSDSASAVSDALAPPAETVRSCAGRERRLTEYIRAHTGEDIAVRLTSHVPTACVLPTSEDALIDSDNAEFSDDQARQLVESVDADYLVLISTHPANVDNLPITDQLTADRAQQFGYALHELGHIRYTAIADAAARLEERVDEKHQKFVHGLWNSCEDAAIENQLAVAQSQLAADRLELVSRSISTHADSFAAEECCEFTFRDAVETALYDEGIYDTGVRDALCDPDDDRIVFVGDADRQAFEQVTDSIEELVAAVLSTPNSVERVEHVLDWWETVVKPLLDPSEQEKQESEQPDPAGVTGESSTRASTSANSSSSTSSEGREIDQSTNEGADADRSSSGKEEQDEGGIGDSESGTDKPDTSRRDESATMDNIDETAGSESEKRPDPEEINTDQRQPSPGADALDYPDIGGDEDADALDQPESNGGSESGSESEGESEGESDSQSPTETTDDVRTTEGGRDAESDLDTADDAPAETDTETGGGDTEAGGEDTSRDTADTLADSDNGTGSNDEEGHDDTTDSGTDAGSHEKIPGSDDEPASPEDSSSANLEDTTDAAGKSSEQDSDGESEGATPESQLHENPWGTNNTSQTSLGSFSTPSPQTASGASCSDGDESDDTSANASDTKRDSPSTDAGGAGEPESESESDESDTKNSPGDITTEDKDESSNEERESARSGNDGDEEPPESRSIDNESADQEGRDASDDRATDEDGRDTTAGAGGVERSETPNESISESDEQPPKLTPVHADGDDGLNRDGALDTDREAAHDEAERATPDEQVLERDLEDVADALDALAEQDGGGAAPGSLSELTIMPDRGGSSTADTAERWGAAAADAEFVADALRKALKESRRDAHRSGVTSGTFDRQRAGALARGDVGAFHVRQPGDDKQYDFVMILDRSGSMRRHIQTAENALVRFALACEDIGINVGVIDFTQEEARLIKPFSVECEHVRASLFSRQTGGGTPLADALGLGRELLEQRRNSPLVLIVTDGKPGDEDAYRDELAQSYAPVCGLTLVLDHPAGNVPEKVARNERFYDRHVYVRKPSQLADRLDQFAVMFDGL